MDVAIPPSMPVIFVSHGFFFPSTRREIVAATAEHRHAVDIAIATSSRRLVLWLTHSAMGVLAEVEDYEETTGRLRVLISSERCVMTHIIKHSKPGHTCSEVEVGLRPDVMGDEV